MELMMGGGGRTARVYVREDKKTGQKSEGQALQMDDRGIANLRLYRSGYGIWLSIVDCWSDDV